MSRPEDLISAGEYEHLLHEREQRIEALETALRRRKRPTTQGRDRLITARKKLQTLSCYLAEQPDHDADTGAALICSDIVDALKKAETLFEQAARVEVSDDE